MYEVMKAVDSDAEPSLFDRALGFGREYLNYDLAKRESDASQAMQTNQAVHAALMESEQRGHGYDVGYTDQSFTREPTSSAQPKWLFPVLGVAGVLAVIVVLKK